jgi:hypothetical protein
MYKVFAFLQKNAGRGHKTYMPLKKIFHFNLAAIAATTFFSKKRSEDVFSQAKFRRKHCTP